MTFKIKYRYGKIYDVNGLLIKHTRPGAGAEEANIIFIWFVIEVISA